jgi:23S rRNA (uracil1939-C5)-methyltransferase
MKDLDLLIEKPAAGGRMIARDAGRIVLVAAAIPGERVRARVERVSKGVVYATTVEVLQPSADRRAVTADWLCGGNVYAHVAYDRQLQIKTAIIGDGFARIARLPLDRDVPITGSKEHGYRMRARLHVRPGRIGFYREGTHELCDVRQTGQLLPQTADVLERLADALRREHVDSVTSIELAENVPADERALHFEVDRAVHLAPLAAAIGPGVTGLGYTGPFSSLPSVVQGSPVVKDRVAVPTPDGERTMWLQRNVRSFFQGNRYLLPTLVARVTALVDPGPVIDLYAGVGLFGVALAVAGRSQIAAVEGDRTSAQDLKANAAAYGEAIETSQEAVERFLVRGANPPSATLIVDPPRTGMSREALNAIAGYGAPSIVYVSCDVATLARDVRRLVDAGYALEHIEAFDLFPNTAHVEAVVKLRIQ